MRLKAKNLKKLASLSALGAGALTVASVDADAGTIVYVDLSPGIGVTGNGSAFLPLLGSAQLRVSGIFQHSTSTFYVCCSGTKGSSYQRRSRIVFRGAAFVASHYGTASLSSLLRIFGKGQKWTAAMRASSTATIGWRNSFGGRYRSFGSSGLGDGGFANQYALFRFTGGSGQTLYGWLELSYSGSPQGFSRGPSSGPLSATLEGYAFDTSGAFIAAGDTGASSVPEPSSFELTGLAALALGAAGVRRWKSARKAA